MLVLDGGEGQLVGLDDELTSLPVYVGQPAGVLRLQALPQAADGRDAHGAGQDGGVAVAGAVPGGEGQDAALVQLDGLGGRQIVGAQNHRLLRVEAAGGDPHEVVEDTPGHVPHVRGPGLHVGVVHVDKHLRELDASLLHGVLDAAALLPQGAHDGGHIVLIVHEHGVGLKEDGGLVAGLPPALFRQNLQLGLGLLLGLRQAPLLLLQVLRRALDDGGVRPVVKVDRAVLHAGGDALALYQNHRCLPIRSYCKRDSIPRPARPAAPCVIHDAQSLATL